MKFYIFKMGDRWWITEPVNDQGGFRVPLESFDSHREAVAYVNALTRTETSCLHL